MDSVSSDVVRFPLLLQKYHFFTQIPRGSLELGVSLTSFINEDRGWVKKAKSCDKTDIDCFETTHPKMTSFQKGDTFFLLIKKKAEIDTGLKIRETLPEITISSVWDKKLTS